MSEFSWDDEAQAHAHEHPAAEEPVETRALAVSAHDFSALEERILRAVTLLKQERQARTDAEARAVLAESQHREQASSADELQKEVAALRAERNEVRQRVDRLLSQLDALEL